MYGKITYVMIELIILIITKVQANDHIPTFLHPSPLHIHHSHTSPLDTSNDHGPLVSCIKERVSFCHELPGKDPEFHLICIRSAFVTCLKRDKDDPMHSKINSWVFTCHREVQLGKAQYVASCLLKFFLEIIVEK